MKNKTNQSTAPAPDLPVERSQPLPRRSFMKLVLGGLSALAAVEIGAVSLSFLQSQQSSERVGGHVVAGKISDFPPNSVSDFTHEGFYLIRDSEGNFMALYQKCPHLGCNVHWETQTNQFVCPCHASSFDMYGEFEAPPVPRPLDTFGVYIEGDEIIVDTTQVNRREKFDVQQLVIPNSG